MQRFKPVVLTTLSGIGIGSSVEGNAVRQARMPVFAHLVETYPAMTLKASGAAVGLDEARVGSAEAGHRTIGLGRAWYASDARVDAAIAGGTLERNPALRRLAEHLRTHRGTLHLAGLLTPAEIYADAAHVYALLDYARAHAVPRVAVHVILDGVDAMPHAGLDSVRELERRMRETGTGCIASVSGRAWAMDHNGRWDRTERAYNAMARGRSPGVFGSAEQAIEAWYAGGGGDDALPPTVILRDGRPLTVLQEGDGVVFWNVRPYGVRQLVKAFVLPSFSAFDRPYAENVYAVTLTEYEKQIPVDVAFPPQVVETCLGKVLSDAGLRQLRIAETERYAHVTAFLNGMQETVFPGEERVIVPSPHVSTYDDAPEMSTPGITDRAVKAIAAGTYDAIVVNFAAADLVARTGNMEAAVLACQAVDKALGKVVDAALAVGGAVCVVGDHGHAEEMRDPATGLTRKEGSLNPVPFIVAGKTFEGLKAPSGDAVGGELSATKPAGSLADVAPTVLSILGLAVPTEMEGRPLL